VVVSGSDDRTVRVWDAATGRPVGDPFTGHTDWVTAVAVGQLDGRTVVVSGSSDRTVRVWDAATGRPVGDPFTGHTDYVNAVAVGQLDGRTVVVSGSDDRTVRAWDAATGRPVGDSPPENRGRPQPPSTIDLAVEVLGVTCSPESHIFIGTHLGIVGIRLTLRS